MYADVKQLKNGSNRKDFLTWRLPIITPRDSNPERLIGKRERLPLLPVAVIIKPGTHHNASAELLPDLDPSDDLLEGGPALSALLNLSKK